MVLSLQFNRSSNLFPKLQQMYMPILVPYQLRNTVPSYTFQDFPNYYGNMNPYFYPYTSTVQQPVFHQSDALRGHYASSDPTSSCATTVASSSGTTAGSPLKTSAATSSETTAASSLKTTAPQNTISPLQISTDRDAALQFIFLSSGNDNFLK